MFIVCSVHTVVTVRASYRCSMLMAACTGTVTLHVYGLCLWYHLVLMGKWHFKSGLFVFELVIVIL